MLNSDGFCPLDNGCEAFWMTAFGSSKTDFGFSTLVSVACVGFVAGFSSDFRFALRSGARIKNFFFSHPSLL